MSSMHQHAITFLGSCDCDCHRDRAADCWCGLATRSTMPHPYKISHNDAVAHLQGCPACAIGAHGACRVPTELLWRQGFDRKDRSDHDRRIRSGQIRNGSDVARAIRLGFLRPGNR